MPQVNLQWLSDVDSAVEKLAAVAREGRRRRISENIKQGMLKLAAGEVAKTLDDYVVQPANQLGQTVVENVVKPVDRWATDSVRKPLNELVG
jgi:hypothetical protein